MVESSTRISQPTFTCPRCLAFVESAELSRHLRLCVKHHLQDIGALPAAQPICISEPAEWRSARADGEAAPSAPPAAAVSRVTDSRSPRAAAPEGLRVCPLCCKMVNQRDLANHMDECPENKLSCQHCSAGVCVAQYDEHLRVCAQHRQRCYICGKSVQFADLGAHLSTCATDGKVLQMFHGTDLVSARAILREGFRASERGTLGIGVYLTRDIDKARRYGPVIIEARVHVGRVLVVDRIGHPYQRNWNRMGYDAAWIPPAGSATKVRLEEHCVYDSTRVAVLGLRSEA
jgi:hypothetical protein